MQHILIIEDNLEVRENLAEILELDGYKCSTAENGKVGVKMAIETTPDLIICDVMMPELDGFGVLKIVHKHPVLMHVPFLFLTAKAEKTDFRRGMGLGADDYLTKPFDDVQLLETIEMRLKKSAELKTIVEKTAKQVKSFYDPANAKKAIDTLLEGKEERRYQKNDVIYEAGHYPRWIFYVESGSVKRFKLNDLGKELIVDFVTQGDIFGVDPTFNHEKYHNYTTAVTDCRLRLISIEDYHKALFTNPDLTQYAIRQFASRTRYYEEQLLNFAYSSVRKKVANALIELSSQKGSDVIRLNRSNLANYAGIAKETLIRTLSDFKNEKRIEIMDDSLKIIDAISLEHMPQ